MGKLSDAVKTNKKQREDAEAKREAEKRAASEAAYKKSLELSQWYFPNRLPAIFEDEDAKPIISIGHLSFKYKGKPVAIRYVEPDNYFYYNGYYEIYCSKVGTLSLGQDINQDRVLEFLERIS